MSLNCEKLKTEIIEPTLMQLNMMSGVAVNLMLGTAGVESDFGKFRKQINGPALSIYGEEKSTYIDCWRYINRSKQLAKAVKKIVPYASADTFELVENDDVLATIICRIKYWMQPEGIPNGDVKSLAEYWKKYYNTEKGKGTVEDFIKKYEQYVTC